MRYGDGRFINKKKSGELYIEDALIGPIKDEDKIISFFAIKEDIGHKLELQNKILHNETHDRLTNLINRQEFEIIISNAVSTIKPKQTHIVAIIELTNLKIINDLIGYKNIDIVVLEFSNLISKEIRKNDTLSRLNENKFGILFQNTNLENVYEICARIQKKVKKNIFKFQSIDIEITSSIGLSIIDDTSSSWSVVLANADVANLRAKENDKNNIEIFTNTETFISYFKKMENYVKLKTSLKENKFILFCQKIESVLDKNNYHFEVLLRMIDGDVLVEPNEFLDVAENYQLMYDIDMWVIENTFLFMSTITEQKNLFTINLSSRTVSDIKTLAKIKTLFEKYSIDPQKIGFEITETSIISNYKIAKDTIDNLKKMGCKILLDDFGSGMSSFSRLQLLNINMLKIDGSFIENILISEFDKIIVKSCVSIAKELGIETVAEYVKNKEIYNSVKELGVNFAQGFYVSQPMPLCSSICGFPANCDKHNANFICEMETCGYKKFIDEKLLEQKDINIKYNENIKKFRIGEHNGTTSGEIS